MKIPLLFALVGTLGSACWAQPDDNLPALVNGNTSVQDVEKKTYSLVLKNVKPSVVAWWLDPLNHEQPSGIVPAPPRKMDALANTGAGVFVLPDGVDSVSAIDPQNALLAFGTEKGVAALRETLRFLDRPLRRIELEASFIHVSPADLRKLGLEFKSKSSPDVSRVNGTALSAALTVLQAQGTAQIVSEPRVTDFDQSLAQLKSTVITPIPPGNTKALEVLLDGIDLPKTLDGRPVAVEHNERVEVTPGLNSDNTITLTLRGKRDVQLYTDKPTSPSTSYTALPLKSWQSQDELINVREGEIIAVRIPQSQPHDADEPTTIVVLSARPVPQKA